MAQNPGAYYREARNRHEPRRAAKNPGTYSTATNAPENGGSISGHSATGQLESDRSTEGWLKDERQRLFILRDFGEQPALHKKRGFHLLVSSAIHLHSRRSRDINFILLRRSTWTLQGGGLLFLCYAIDLDSTRRRAFNFVLLRRPARVDEGVPCTRLLQNGSREEGRGGGHWQGIGVRITWALVGHWWALVQAPEVCRYHFSCVFVYLWCSVRYRKPG